jgi:hypothetical protein
MESHWGSTTSDPWHFDIIGLDLLIQVKVKMRVAYDG